MEDVAASLLIRILLRELCDVFCALPVSPLVELPLWGEHKVLTIKVDDMEFSHVEEVFFVTLMSRLQLAGFGHCLLGWANEYRRGNPRLMLYISHAATE